MEDLPREPVPPDDALADELDLAPGPAPEGGMLTLAELERREAAEKARRAALPVAPESAGGIPETGDERLKQLKTDARRKIEEGLIAKRKRRRLLRGGDVSR